MDIVRKEKKAECTIESIKDGTVFYSPADNQFLIKTCFKDDCNNVLCVFLDTGGYGWFMQDDVVVLVDAELHIGG